MRAHIGDVDIEYEIVGPDDGEPIVLIAGVFQQLTFWPEAFVAQLGDAGLRVVILDNRDVGLSTWETRPAPDLMTVLGGDVSGVNYTLADMAGDVAGLIEHLGLDSAHVLGHSMGGGIAQYVATRFPDRVRSLTLFGTAPFEGVTGQSSPAFLELVMGPTPTDPEGAWEAGLAAYRICAEPEPIDEEVLVAFLQAQVDRAANPAMQCIQAILASVVIGATSTPTHLEDLEKLRHPTLVIHGTGDLAVGVDGGERLAEVIPGARLVLLEGMGHVPLAPQRWSTIADEVITHALKA